MAESPVEEAAPERLDEETRDIGWQELQKEADREADIDFMNSGFMSSPSFGVSGPLSWFGRPRLFGRSKRRDT